jgi:hypothetical protein
MVVIDQLRDFATLTETEDDNRIIEDKYHVGEQLEMRSTINEQTFDVPLVIVRTDSGVKTEAIINHELQHVINNDFIGRSTPDRDAPFSLTDQTSSIKGEPNGSERVRRAKYFRQVKDEVLAFIRENGDLEVNLRDIGSYHKLYGKFTNPKDQKAAKKLTRDILQSLATIRLWDAGPHGRALLVNLLYPISFERLPEWIPHMRRFYKMYLADPGQDKAL